MMFNRPNKLEGIAKKLEGYFDRTRALRTVARNGAIIVISEDPSTFNFLQFLVKEGHLRTSAMHFGHPAAACVAIDDAGEGAIKAIIIDGELRKVKLKGAKTILEWLSEAYPGIPVFVDRCPPEDESDIRQVSSRIGIFKDGTPRQAYVKALGLPPSCCAFATP